MKTRRPFSCKNYHKEIAALTWIFKCPAWCSLASCDYYNNLTESNSTPIRPILVHRSKCFLHELWMRKELPANHGLGLFFWKLQFHVLEVKLLSSVVHYKWTMLCDFRPILGGWDKAHFCLPWPLNQCGAIQSTSISLLQFPITTQTAYHCPTVSGRNS